MAQPNSQANGCASPTYQGEPGPRPVTRGDSGALSKDRFEKVKVLGRGAFGVALLIREKEPKNVSTNGKSQDVFRVAKQVNLAELAPDKRKETLNEVEVLRRLDSCPNVVAYLGAFLDGTVLNIVMEYADGGDLSSAIRQRKEEGLHFDEDVVLKVFAQCIFGLSHMHRQRILHRDIKGQNIFLTKAGQAKLGDFGIARIFEHTESQAQTTIGTPSYLAPEVCENMPYGPKADIWSIGVVLYELMALQQPFQAYNIAALVIRILTAEPPPLPEEYSQELQDLAKRTLEKKPEDRPSADEIRNEPMVRQRVASKFDVTNTSSGWRPRTGDSTRPGSRAKSTRRRASVDDSSVDPFADSSWQPSSSSTATARQAGAASPAEETIRQQTIREPTQVLSGTQQPSDEVTARLPGTSSWQLACEGETTLEAAPDQLEKLLQDTQSSMGSRSSHTGDRAHSPYVYHKSATSELMEAAQEQARFNREFAQKQKLKVMGDGGGFLFAGTSATDPLATADTTAASIPGYNNEAAGFEEFTIRVFKDPAMKWGLEFDSPWDDDGLRKDIFVEAVQIGISGFFEKWNMAHPSHALHAGDRVVKVNRASGNALHMLKEFQENPELEITVRRPCDNEKAWSRPVQQEQRGRTFREARQGSSSSLQTSGGGSPGAMPRSPLLGAGSSMIAETTAKAPGIHTPSGRTGRREPGGDARSTSRPGHRPLSGHGGSRPGSAQSGVGGAAPSRLDARPNTGGGSSGGCVAQTQRQRCVVQAKPQSVVCRSRVGGPGAAGQATAASRGATPLRTQSPGPRQASRTPSSKPQRKVVASEALDDFMRKVEEQERLDEERRLSKHEEPQNEAQPLTRSSLTGQPAAQETQQHDSAPMADTAIKERFPHFAQFADQQLSLSSPMVVRQEEEKRDDQANMQDLLAQIANLDAQADEGGGRAASPNVDDDDTWGVADLPPDLSGMNWDSVVQATNMPSAADKRLSNFTDSWSGIGGVCSSENFGGATLPPESPSCGETMALEKVLLGGVP